jgi:tRNA U34 5-methylaminomethyl-2-thiouridine-forming methyltransferase MnmC
MRPPIGHQLIQTDDGTPTLFSERFSEACHSTAGAKAETEKHYLQGCHIAHLLRTQSQTNILEVGFGTGLGFRETLKLAQSQQSGHLNFTSLEIDEELVKWAIPDAIRKECGDICYYFQQGDKFELTIIVGDARKVLPHFSHQLPAFHAIYQDAFSPKKNPTLWTKEWFSLLGSMSLPGAYLSTYSASISIRKALMDVGWGISIGESFAQKRSSTRARWQMPSDAALIEQLQNHSILALCDADIMDGK